MFIELTIYSLKTDFQTKKKSVNHYKHTINIEHIIDFHKVKHSDYDIDCVEMILNYPNGYSPIYYAKDTYEEIKAKIIEAKLGKLGEVLYAK